MNDTFSAPYSSLPLSQYSFAITGGAGFIGSHLVEYLSRNKAGKIIVLDDLSTGNKKNMQMAEGYSGFKFMQGSICNPEACEEAFKGVDFVLHQAAMCSVPRSLVNPAATNEANVSGFLNVLVAAKNARVKRIVYASSSSVYGDSSPNPTPNPQMGDKGGGGKGGPKSESDGVSPLSPYAVTKYTNELYASVFQRNFGLNLIGLRYFNIFGPRQNPHGQYAAAIPLFISSLLEDKSPVIYGDGNQTRDFTFIDNVVQANIKALFSPTEANGQVFNIAGGERNSVNGLFNILKDLSGSNVMPEYKPYRTGDVKDSFANISKAGTYLNYSPEVHFKEGIETTWKWFKNNYEL